jgi:RNA polymerase sigma factor (sigma-70 family)
MANSTLGLFLYELRRAAAGRPSSDGQLLERFAMDRDEVAFETLLQRHGPMVWNVCHRMLTDPNDVEDAFQATFLVLVRKAQAIAKRESIGSWLHGVAHRVALDARLQAKHRRERERKAAPPACAQPDTELLWNDLRHVLDEELEHLPEKYRSPLVLCYLEGKTNDEAADQLGWTRGTVAGRLNRARELLRGRLTRRGITLASGALVSLMSPSAAPAGMSALLARTTLQAALAYSAGTAMADQCSSSIALAEGVLTTMHAWKIRTVIAIVMMLGMLGIGGGVLARRALAASEPVGPAAAAPVPAAAAPAGVPAAAGPNRVQQPIAVWTGPHSAIGTQAYARITDRNAWEALWKQHAGKNIEKGIDGTEVVVPELNLNAYMVVAVFTGETFNSRGVEAVSITEDDEQVLFRFRERGFGTVGDAVAVRPYGLFLVARAAKRLVLERDVRSTKNEPPQWKEVARFEKLLAAAQAPPKNPAVAEPKDVGAPAVEKAVVDNAEAAAFAEDAGAAPSPPVPYQHHSFFKHLLISNGPIFGLLMLIMTVAAVRLMVVLAWGLRAPRKSVDWERYERALRWLLGIGVLSPMIGLLGTLLGLMQSAMVLGIPGSSVRPDELAKGFSHAAVVVTEQLLLGSIAIVAFVLFKNRLQRLRSMEP